MKDWQSILITPETTIRSALAKIDSAATKIGLVIDSEHRLLGTITDGDIRRALLAGFSLEDEVKRCMNTRPTVARIDDSRESILSKMRNLLLHQIPIVDASGIVVNLALIDDYLTSPKRENWVVIMAGGPGTRLRELTKKVPKPMLVVGARPILETIVCGLVEQGFRNIWIAVNYRAEQIERHFGDGNLFGANINYLREKTRLGTAGALSLLPSRPDQPILVSNADLLAKIDYNEMLDNHCSSNAVATMAVREYEYQIPFGVVRTDDGTISEIEEKPVHRVLVNAGVYVLSPEVVDHVPARNFFDMTQLFDTLVERGLNARCHQVHGYWLDIGRHDDFCKANNDYGEVFP